MAKVAGGFVLKNPINGVFLWEVVEFSHCRRGIRRIDGVNCNPCPACYVAADTSIAKFFIDSQIPKFIYSFLYKQLTIPFLSKCSHCVTLLPFKPTQTLYHSHDTLERPAQSFLMIQKSPTIFPTDPGFRC